MIRTHAAHAAHATAHAATVVLPTKTARKAVVAVRESGPRDHLMVAITTVAVESWAILNVEILALHLSIAFVLFGREVLETILSVDA